MVRNHPFVNGLVLGIDTDLVSKAVCPDAGFDRDPGFEAALPGV
jgi:hypothetical protein